MQVLIIRDGCIFFRLDNINRVLVLFRHTALCCTMVAEV
jgi:hypothetical protein